MNKLYPFVVGGNLLKVFQHTCPSFLPNKRTHGFEVALNVAYVATPRAAWILTRVFNHKFVKTFLIKDTPVNDLEADDLRTLFKEVDRRWRHGTWQDAADVCMVTP